VAEQGKALILALVMSASPGAAEQNHKQRE
jgi:hypothetical protein